MPALILILDSDTSFTSAVRWLDILFGAVSTLHSSQFLEVQFLAAQTIKIIINMNIVTAMRMYCDCANFRAAGSVAVGY